MKFAKISSKPRKKRKALYTAPLHERQKLVGAHLNKELRARFKKRTLPLRKGDRVRVLRGDFKKKEGKVMAVVLKRGIARIEGCVLRKQSGKEVLAALRPSNLLITEAVERKQKPRRKQETKKQTEKTT